MLIMLTLLGLFNWLPPITFTPIYVDPIANLTQLIWPALAVGYQLERASMEVVDVAARSLGGISAGDGNVHASRPCPSFRQPDRCDFWIGERHAWNRRVIGPRVRAPNSARHDLPVIVGDVSEPTESRDVTGSEDARLRFER